MTDQKKTTFGKALCSLVAIIYSWRVKKLEQLAKKRLKDVEAVRLRDTHACELMLRIAFAKGRQQLRHALRIGRTLETDELWYKRWGMACLAE